MPEYLKRAPQYDTVGSDQIRRTVSEMLISIESEGQRAIREYSRALDDWDPPPFLVSTAAANADHGLSDALVERIAFAQEQVRVSRRRSATRPPASR
jgi:sulfopropanediol 3-dehydrogenase